MALSVSVSVWRFKCPHNDVLRIGQSCSCFWCSKPMEKTWMGEITVEVKDNKLVASVTADRVAEGGLSGPS